MFLKKLVDFPASHIDWPEETKHHDPTIILEKTEHLPISRHHPTFLGGTTNKNNYFLPVTSSMIRA